MSVKSAFHKLSDQKKGFIFTFLSVLTSSFYVIFYSRLSKMVSPANATFLLYHFSCLFSLIHIWQAGWQPLLFTKYRKELIYVTLSTMFGNYLVANAIRFVNPGMVQVLQRADVFFGALLGKYFFQEPLTKKLGLCILIAILGVFVMRFNVIQGSSLSGSWLDYSLILAGTFFYALTQTYAKKVVFEVDPNALNAYRLVLSVVVLWFLFPFFPPADLTAPVVLLLGMGSGFFGPFATRSLLFYGVKYLELTKVFFLVTTTPIVTMALQAILYQELVTLNEFFGSLIVLLAVLLFTYKKPRPRRMHRMLRPLRRKLRRKKIPKLPPLEL